MYRLRNTKKSKLKKKEKKTRAQNTDELGHGYDGVRNYDELKGEIEELTATERDGSLCRR